jgi:ADP-ribose pyrophosphatase YjhB (NUDIX family)
MTDITTQLAMWIQQLCAIAQTGLAFDPHAYDRERYQALLDLSAQMAAALNRTGTLDPDLADALAKVWRAEVVSGVAGYVTPKVGVGAVVFNAKDEILLIQRPEGGWLFPTGWADVGYTPAQIATKEVREETGLDVTPVRLVGIYDSKNWRPELNPHFYSIVFYCQLNGGEVHPHPVETLDVGFFAREALPDPLYRLNTNWVEHAWAAHRNAAWQPYFDQ